MEFFTDHYFQIGSVHYLAGKPCQDHALAHADTQGACAIVSDGCSTGGANTDMGARILTFSTLKASLETADDFIVRQHELLHEAERTLGIHPEDMLATCLHARIAECGGVIHIQGDGVVSFKYRDGAVLMMRYEWARNMPFYPSYEGAARDRFIESHGSDLDAICLTAECVARTADGTIVREETHSYTLREGIGGILLDIPRDELERIEYVALFTDGVAQIENVGWRDAVATLLAFKTTKGEFAKRRMIRGIKDMRQLGRGPLDDIAIAAIRVVYEEHGKEVEHGSEESSTNAYRLA